MNNELLIYYVNEPKYDLEYCLQYFIKDYGIIDKIVYSINNNSLIKISNNTIYIVPNDYHEIDDIPIVNIHTLKNYISIFNRIDKNTIIIDINSNNDYELFVSIFSIYYRIIDYINALKKEYFYIILIDNQAFLTRKSETNVILDNINSIDIQTFIRINKMKNIL